MGERLAGSQKVRGSSPLSSTLPSGSKPQGAADPGKTGVFFCAGKSVGDSLQPLTEVCCVVFCVTFCRARKIGGATFDQLIKSQHEVLG